MKASPEQLVALRYVAGHLGSLRDEVVFLGGMVTGLLVTDPGAPVARSTDDIDLIVEVASTLKYQTELRDRLLAIGFRESAEDDVVCRWRLGEWVVDVMPTAPGVLGFSNPWYPHAMATAVPVELPPGTSGPLSIRVVSAPAFLATKLVAWEGRGNGDLLHPDIEDIVASWMVARTWSGKSRRTPWNSGPSWPRRSRRFSRRASRTFFKDILEAMRPARPGCRASSPS